MHNYTPLFMPGPCALSSKAMIMMIILILILVNRKKNTNISGYSIKVGTS